MTTAEAQRRVTDLQAHYAESALDAIRSIGPKQPCAICDDPDEPVL